MSINVRWLAVALLVIWNGLQPLAGQHCPSIPEALKALYAAEDGGEAVVQKIKAECPSAADSLSVIFHKRSVYAYNSEEDWALAIDYGLKALAAQEEIYAGEPAEPLGKTLANLGLFYRLTGQYTISLPYLRRANAVFTELGLYKRKHRNHQQMIKLWHATGDVGRSEELLRVMLAETRTEKANGGDERTVALAEAETYRLLGVQANQTEQYAEGLSDFDAAAALFEELGDVRWLLMSYMGQGRALYHLKQYEEARVVTLKALALAERYELNFDKGVMCNLLALIENEQFHHKQAQAFQQQGENYARQEDNPLLLSVLINTDAEIALGQKDFTAAKSRNAEAISLLTNGWKYNEEATLPTLEEIGLSEFKLEIFQFLAFRANIFHKAGDVAGAMEVIRLTDQFADLLRQDFNGQVSNLFWRQEALPLYELGIELSQGNKDSEAAFYFLEKSRSMLLLEAMITADVRENISPELAGQLTTVEHELRTLRQKPVNEDADNYDEIARRIVALSDTLQQLRAALAEQFPAARELIANPDLTNISEARSLLKQGLWDRQVHFFMGKKRTTVFSLTATETKAIDLGPTAELDTLLRRVLAFYTGAGVIDRAPADFIAASHAVYQKILAPLNIDQGERLLIIPDGILAYLPFGALVTGPGDASVATAPYLIRRNQVSLAQSTTVLRQQSKDSGTASGGAFAFSPFSAALPNRTDPPLPFSEAEIEGLQNHYPPIWLNGPEASREGLLTGLNDRSIIHLSTHAYASTDQHEQPRILTASEPVYLSDIYGVKLQAGLVTLSACQSNIGQLAQGEGVLSLGRAFTAAGADGVIASLWSLNDKAASEIVTGLYDQLAQGASKPEALHRAKLAYLNREDMPAYLKSPYYWAGLTYYGDSGKLPTDKGIPAWGWAMLLLIVLAVVVWHWPGRK